MANVYLVGKCFDNKAERVGVYLDKTKAEEALMNAAHKNEGGWVSIQAIKIGDEEAKK